MLFLVAQPISTAKPLATNSVRGDGSLGEADRNVKAWSAAVQKHTMRSNPEPDDITAISYAERSVILMGSVA